MARIKGTHHKLTEVDPEMAITRESYVGPLEPLAPIRGTPSTPEPVEPDWRDLANCADMDPALFFPKENVAAARHIELRIVCAGCVVREQCLDFALSTNQAHGFWGGMNENERRRVRKERRR